MTRLHRGIKAAVAVALSCFFTTEAIAQRYMENLGRGVVAVNQGGGKVYVGWRLLGTDPDEIAFNVYRSTGGGLPIKLNKDPIKDSTNFVDSDVKLDQEVSYSIRPVLSGQEQEASKPFLNKIPAGSAPRPYISIPLRTLPGYSPNDASVGDLDGDGEYEIVLHQTGRARDNSRGRHNGRANPRGLQARRHASVADQPGQEHPRGAHYTQFMVYDLDGDGKAEIVCKTADGTVDGTGKVIGDPQGRLPQRRGATS